MDKQRILRNLPRVDDLAELVKKESAAVNLPAAIILKCCRQVLDDLRGGIITGEISQIPQLKNITADVLAAAKSKNEYSLRPVINATGVVLHTNLGRAVLCADAVENVRRVASSYSTLEYDVASGERGSRHSHIESLICELTGAEAAMAVNNNAAAVMLTLMTMCKGREVVVSRGELVEIGGSFRVPDIMALSGAILREVGTTNKTKPSDYIGAVSANTAALLKVHTSNFKIVGFSEDVGISELSGLGTELNIPVIYDLGSGLMGDGFTYKALNGNNYDIKTAAGVVEGIPAGTGLKTKAKSPEDITGEITVLDSIKSGADIVCFSADKLFGGPQAGIIAGKKRYIDAIKKNQFARVVRIDKLTLAALEATLKAYRDPVKAAKIPTLANIAVSQDELRRKANKLKQMLALNRFDKTDDVKAGSFSAEGGILDNIENPAGNGLNNSKNSKNLNKTAYSIAVKQSQGQVGGGSAPGENLPSYVVEVSSDIKSAQTIENELRKYETPVIARINKGRVLLDVRTISESDFKTVALAFKTIFKA